MSIRSERHDLVQQLQRLHFVQTSCTCLTGERLDQRLCDRRNTDQVVQAGDRSRATRFCDDLGESGFGRQQMRRGRRDIVVNRLPDRQIGGRRGAGSCCSTAAFVTGVPLA